MTLPNGISLRVFNYKSFGEEGGGFDIIKPLNVIIGRNNSGKSALVDIVEYACNPRQIPDELYHSRNTAQIVFDKTLEEHELRPLFSESTGGGDINGNHWNDAGAHLIGARVRLSLHEKTRGFIAIRPDLREKKPNIGNIESYYKRLGQTVENPFSSKTFKRLLADRDIGPEQDSGTLVINPNGSGFTSTVAQILNKSFHPSELVESNMLAALNAIFSPDALFTDILVQQRENGAWEVFLTEESKGRISLSNSGSGLKTVLLVIAFVELLPYIEKKVIGDFIFSLEELENNLHPALQRRLINYIRKIAVDAGCITFLTTHSSNVIDLLSHDNEAQIIHVQHGGRFAKSNVASTYVSHHGILDDLDVRASDLLQSNSIVWVEGPSDRLYFNRWIEIWTNGKLREGLHYQCVFYGGRLLAHLSADDPDVNPDDVVKILRVNRNALVLIDSDKRALNGKLNDTKKRIIQEVENFSGLAWVTKGKEVENYLPLATIQALYPKASTPLGQFEDIAEYLEQCGGKGEGNKFRNAKVMYAERFIPHLTLDDLKKVHDLEVRMGEVVDAISAWNGFRSRAAIG